MSPTTNRPATGQMEIIMETEKVQEVPVEKIFLLGYEKGNGYHCGCCRSTHMEVEEFDSLDGIKWFLERAQKNDEDIEPLWIQEAKPKMMEFSGTITSAIALIELEIDEQKEKKGE